MTTVEGMGSRDERCRELRKWVTLVRTPHTEDCFDKRDSYKGGVMASLQSTVDDLLDRLTGAGRVSAKKMFGEYCIYLDGKPVALVCNDRLYLKSTDAGRQLMPDVAEEPPYPGAKPHLVLAPESWDDREALCQVVRATLEALPRPKPRKRKA